MASKKNGKSSGTSKNNGNGPEATSNKEKTPRPKPLCQYMSDKQYKRLQKLLTDEQMKNVNAAFSKFLKLEFEDAVNAFTAYVFQNARRADTLKYLGLSDFPEEALCILFREFRKNFEKKSNPFEDYIPENCKADFLRLRNKAHSVFGEKKDYVSVAFCLYEQLRRFMQNKNDDSVRRAIFLLESKEENFFFGGLQTVFYSENTLSEMMKPLANHIGNLLKAMATAEEPNSSSKLGSLVNLTVVVAEKSATEEAHTEEAVAEDAHTEEDATVEDATTEKATTAEATAEEAPAEETHTEEDAPVEETHAEDAVAEEAHT